MDDKERKLFTLMWQLLGDYHAIMREFLPVVADISSTLAVDNPKPSPQQLAAWKSKYDALHAKTDKASEHFESLRQIADPLFGYDA